ncbi:MAG: hypothetical protein ACRD6X_14765, partial [Pyrinomonadaceae bacterium]
MKFARMTIIFILALVVSASAQESPFPNELPGFEFFGKGKLKDLRLGVSTRDDVKKIFGRECENRCNYDADWSIGFEYYDDIWIKENRNEKGEKLTYLLDPKYLGKVHSILIYPKKQISLTDASFPEIFRRLITTSTTDSRSGKSRMTVNDSFQEPNGMTYEIYSRTNYDDIKNKKLTTFHKGDLV